MILYVDTSAWIKLLVLEEHSSALRSFLAARQSQGAVLVSSDVIQVELRRAAIRLGMPLLAVAESLELLATVTTNRELLVRAGTRVFPPGPDGRPISVKSLDAIHIESAIAANAAVIVTYDASMSLAAQSLGLPVLAPG